MEGITKPQLKCLHTLLQKTGMMEAKRDLIYHYSNGRTISSRELLFDECQNIIDHLRENDPQQRMIRKVYALAYDIKIIYSGNDVDRKINIVALDGWLARNSYLHKPLNEYTLAELPKLVSQLTMVLRHNKQSELNKEANRSVEGMLDELGITSNK